MTSGITNNIAEIVYEGRLLEEAICEDSNSC